MPLMGVQIWKNPQSALAVAKRALHTYQVAVENGQSINSFTRDPATDITTITIPNMFQSFVVTNALVHPDYGLVKQESEDWISRFCAFPPEMRSKIKKCNFSLFCAISAPYAPRDKFRTLCDWGNWVFPYDDSETGGSYLLYNARELTFVSVFDNGELKNNPGASQKMMNQLLAPLQGKTVADCEREPILRVHDSVFERLSQPWLGKTGRPLEAVSSKSRQAINKRFSAAMAKYCEGALAHVEDHFAHRIPTLEEMVLIRRNSAGVSPLYHLVEYAHDLHVPPEAFENPLIQELEILGIDLVSISNDILSYQKEEREGVKHNMVAICRLRGMSAQQAFDEVSFLLQSRFDRWDSVESHLRRAHWMDNVNVESYVNGIKSVVQANISWSFHSERYLGKQAQKVQDTRHIQVLTRPPYLES